MIHALNWSISGFKNIGESCVKLIKKSDAPLSLTLHQATSACSRIQAQLYELKTQTDVRYLMVSLFFCKHENPYQKNILWDLTVKFSLSFWIYIEKYHI